MVGEEEALAAFPPGGPPPGGWATAAELQAALSPLEALYAQLLEAVQVCEYVCVYVCRPASRGAVMV